MPKISVCLATFNEEKNIKDCLESVKWADEIVVVDGASTDKTVEIASSIGRSAAGRKKLNIKIIVRENPPMFHINKQKAFEAATGDWILYLDADERVTPELGKEILRVIVTRDTSEESRSLPRHHPRSAGRRAQYEGYWIPRKNIIFGKWIEHTGWYPDYQLRLFKRGRAYLPCKTLHEQPVLKGEAGYLKNPLWHKNYQTISQFITRLNRYTENDKNLFLSEDKKIQWHDAIRFPASEFLKRFFRQEGYKDGLHGLVLSMFQAFSAFVTFAKIWETEGFKENNAQDFLTKTQKELARAFYEIKYWFLTTKVKSTPNLVKKIWYRILRKTS